MSDVAKLPSDYADVLARLKEQVRSAQLRAQRVVNTELIQLYWSIGKELAQRQADEGWRSNTVMRLAEDLRSEFPAMRGFSRSNLFSMRAFAKAWPTFGDGVQQPVGLLPWGHIVALIDKLDDHDARDWYAAAAVERNWSRNMLTNQIANQTRERTGAAPTNFAGQLAAPDSDLAHEIAKDPYVFDFLDLTADAAERDLEQALMDRIVDTLRELGAGFAFVGRQYHLEVRDDNGDVEDYYLDLLFFHTEQLRYVVVELKTGRFRPEYAGKLGFYTALVDDTLRRSAHAPTIGILICGSRNEHTVRYSLGTTTSPMAVSGYTYESLPAAERAVLPPADRIAAALDWTASEADT
jgi:predicted nuclease of restriction endonuclease-like (RecB) superfamily